MGFFKHKKAELPEFWSTYEGQFTNNLPSHLNEIEFVVLDTETTGFDFDQDRILCIGALSLKNRTIAINKSLEIYIAQEHYDSRTAEIHGILKRGNITKVSEEEAITQLLGYLGNKVIVAHHAPFDIQMINKALKRLGLPKLKNTVLDTAVLYKKTLLRSYLLQKKETYALEELADKFDISKKDRHTAIGDAYITAIAFLKILNKLQEKNELTLRSLLK
ncbi:MAG: 3'-5' exonuclease [Saonia sp.]